MFSRIQIRRGSAALWASENPVLASGELGLDTTTGRVKIGDGSTAWVSLPYILDGLEVIPLRAVKGADQSIANQTDYEVDAQLVVPVEADALYAIEGQLDHIASSGIGAGNFRFKFTGPAGARGRTSQSSGSPQNMTELDSPVTANGAAADRSLLIRGNLKTDATAGFFQLEWSQSSSTVNPTTLYGTSWLELRRLA